MGRNRRFSKQTRNEKFLALSQKKKTRNFQKRQKRLENSKKFILNLSNHTLSENEILLLGRGLKFVPTTKLTPNKIMKDFSNFENKLRWKYHFHVSEPREKPNEVVKLLQFWSKSDLVPPLANNAIEDYILATKMDISNTNELEHHTNLTKSERKALQNLKCNDQIIITKSDKSSCTVIWDKNNYIKEGLRHLSGIHYIPIVNLSTENVNKKLKEIFRKLMQNEYLPQYIFDYLTEERTFKTPHFYLLPKIHKIGAQLENVDNLGANANIEVPGRPIISQCGSVRERVGKYLDYFLLPLVKSSEWYLKDTGELLRLLDDLVLPQNVLLVTYDLTSMYTNMEHSEVLRSVGKAYNEWPYPFDIPKLPTEDFMALLEICLYNNEFEFNQNYYKQVIGVAMGSRESPECSDLRKFDLLKDIYAKYNYVNKILLHKVYRDDGFIIFKGSIQEITEFFEIANKEHKLLKFTFDISENEVPFLDLLISKGKHFQTNNKLDTCVYFKPTECFQYLDTDSDHPRNCFKGLIRGETIRYLRNTNDVHVLQKLIIDFKHRLKDRGYKEDSINAEIHKALSMTRKDILELKITDNKSTNVPLCFVTTFNKNLPNLRTVLLKHWNMVENNNTCKRIFQSKPIVAYKRSKNLKEILKNKI